MQAGNGDTLYVDDVTYDMSSKTYNIDAHKEYNFDIENNTYIYYTYNYEYNYYINYTNVTYIGQTAEDIIPRYRVHISAALYFVINGLSGKAQFLGYPCYTFSSL